MIWKAPRIWDGDECWVVGGGLSAARQFGVPEDIIDGVCSQKMLPTEYSKYFEPIHNKHVIGVNNAYLIGDWIDVLFFGDCSWHLVHRTRLHKWPGIKITCCPRFASKRKEDSEGIKFLSKDTGKKHGLTSIRTKVSWNHNSGAAAINVAAHFGAKRIILLGFDMSTAVVGDKKVSHWHGSHSFPDRPLPSSLAKTYERHKRGFPVIAEDAKKLGVEIINTNPNSTITDFVKIPVKDLL